MTNTILPPLQEVDIGLEEPQAFPRSSSVRSIDFPSRKPLIILQSLNISDKSTTISGPFQAPRPSRSLSINSNTLNRLVNSQEAFVVPVNKTPANLTPSQRLKMRKSQLNNAISQYKHEDYSSKSSVPSGSNGSKFIETQPLPPLRRQGTFPMLKRRSTGPKIPKPYSRLDDQEEIIESDTYIFNVPLSQAFSALQQREKYVFSNQDRKMSLTNTDSTRASSILSHVSATDTASVTSFEEDTTVSIQDMVGMDLVSSLNIEDLHLSAEAHKLTLLFNKTDSVLIGEESAQRQRMLASFGRMNWSCPRLEEEDSVDVAGTMGKSTAVVEKKAINRVEEDSDSQSNSESKREESDSNVSHRPIANRNMKRDQQMPEATHKRELASTASVDTKQASASSYMSGFISSFGFSNPVSQTASKYQSFTRPTWLPPKPTADKIQHQKESDWILYQAKLRELKTEAKRIASLQKDGKLKAKDAKIWNDILPDGTKSSQKTYKDKMASKSGKNMIWRGIPSDLRRHIWFEQIGNRLQINEGLCKHYFNLSREMKAVLQKHELAAKLGGGSGKLAAHKLNIVSLKRYFDRLHRDLMNTFPDLNYFQRSKVCNDLELIVTAFVLYYNETDLARELDTKRFSNVDFSCYFTGLNNMAAVIYYHYKNPSSTFLSLCNLYQSNALSLILAYKVNRALTRLTDSQKDVLLRAVDEGFMSLFEKDLKTQLNRLAVHLEVVGLRPIQYAPDMVLAFLSNLVDFGVSCRILDVFVFEGDRFLEAAVLTLMDKISFKLYGSKQDTMNILGERSRDLLNRQRGPEMAPESYKYMNVGIEHEFVERMRSMFDRLS